MTAYAPNFTARMRVGYRAIGANHSLLFRYVGFAPPDAPFVAGVQAFIDELQSSMVNPWVVLSTEWAGQDSDIFLPSPIVVTDPAPTFTDFDTAQRPMHITYIGKSSAASPWRLFLYGVKFDPIDAAETGLDNYRLTSADSSDVPDGYGALAAIPGLVANDGNSLFFKTYCNLNFNRHWIKKNRNG